MPQNSPTPEQERVRDAVSDHWVDTRAPAKLRPYLRLSRVERPIGTWLLLLPCLWGIALGGLSHGGSALWGLYLALACALGSLLMRGAGCTWNDISDREFDAKVARTANRPLARGDVSVRQALLWMGLQMLISLVLLLTMGNVAILLGVLALLPVGIYPFAKRFTWWPQAFLGVAFNWGALLAYGAMVGHVGFAAIFAYGAGIAWTLFYDTIYAHQDTEDDALIGVKSTARLFGDETPAWLRRFAVITVALMTLAVSAAVWGQGLMVWLLALGAPVVLGLHLLWQMRRFNATDGEVLLKLFRSNRDAGLIPLIFIGLAWLL